jgi:nitric oxide reductase NorD protein
MGISDRTGKPEKESGNEDDSPNPRELPENDVHRSAERQSFLKLTRELASLPLEQSAAALDTGAAIAGVSLRAGIEFLRGCRAAAEVLQAQELRAWGEFGRRLAMSDVETAVSFFNEGVEDLRQVPERVRPVIFQLVSRQITLSTAIALDTFRRLPAWAKIIDDQNSLSLILEVAAEVSRRSAKHSAEFLNKTPQVITALSRFDDPQLTAKGIELAGEFAFRAGGIAADAWTALPAALAKLDLVDATRLLKSSIEFLERGGGPSLQILVTGGEILRALPEVFDDWLKLLWIVTRHGNASVVAFIRSSPRFVQSLANDANKDRSVGLCTRVIKLTSEIAEIDGEAALACFRSSTLALRTVSITQFEEWALRGLQLHGKDARARRSYFALETRGSNDALRSGSDGLTLERVRQLLQLYIEALTGREVDISPLASVPIESRISDGRTIHLPSLVAEFGDDELDFRLFKVLAAHAAGQIEFGTHDEGTPAMQAAYSRLAQIYAV